VGLNETEFEALLTRAEGETTDFKAAVYDLSNDAGRLSLVKDVICMANTPRDEESVIILGVKKHADGGYDLRGCEKHPTKQTSNRSLQNVFFRFLLFRTKLSHTKEKTSA
jgi:hypothetical protein